MKKLLPILFFVSALFNLDAAQLSTPGGIGVNMTFTNATLVNPTLNSPTIVGGNVATNNGTGYTFNSATLNGGNVVTTNLLSSAHLIISLTPPSDNNTNWFGPWTPGTTTAGIQEAINSLAVPIGKGVGGGTIEVRPGIYQIGTAILITNKNLTFENPGMASAILLQTNPIPHELLRVDAFGTTNGLIFNASHIAFMSVTNACTNLIALNGEITDNYHGNISRATIDHCWFGFWTSVTNFNLSLNLTPDVADDYAKHNLIPIYINNNLGDFITIENCQFTYVNSLSIANDHVNLLYNAFEGAGSGVANDWGTSSPYARGAAVVFRETDLPSTTVNGNKVWNISGNFFVTRAANFFFYDAFKLPHVIYGNDSEGGGIGTCLTTGSRICFVNPNYEGGGVNLSASGFFDVTNLTDFTQPMQVDTGLVTTASMAFGMRDYVFNATNLFNQFSGTFTGNAPGITNLPVQPIGSLTKTNQIENYPGGATPVTVTNWDSIITSNFTGNAAQGTLTNTLGGTFLISGHVSIDPSAETTPDYWMGIYTNGSLAGFPDQDSDEYLIENAVDIKMDVGRQALTFIAGTRIEIKIWQTDNSPETYKILFANFTVTKQ